jgi:hypothetical protein
MYTVYLIGCALGSEDQKPARWQVLTNRPRKANLSVATFSCERDQRRVTHTQKSFTAWLQLDMATEIR